MRQLTPKMAKLILFVIILVGFLFHLDILTMDLQGNHIWRQSQTMWNIRNFARHDANILNTRVSVFNWDHDNLYRYEFPILQWSIGMFQRVFGEDIMWVRIIMFLIGAGATTGMYRLTKLIVENEVTALITALFFQFSPIFFHYSFTPFPDILALTSTVWYLVYMITFVKSRKWKDLLLASFFILIAALAKLPFLMLITPSIYYFFRLLFKKEISFKTFFQYSLTQFAFLIPAFLWYAWVMPSWGGNPVLAGAFGSQSTWAEYKKLIDFNFQDMFPLRMVTYPIWLLFILGVFQLIRNKYQTNWVYSLIGITFLYLAFEMTTLGVHHDYYMLPFMPWLFVIVGLGVELFRGFFSKSWLVLIAIGILSMVHTFQFTEKWRYYEWSNKDFINYGKELKAAVPRDELCIIMNDLSGYIVPYRVDKMGYVYHDDKLDPAWVDDLVRNHGVQYMYSDSEPVNSNPDLQKYIDHLILQKGTVKVFKLKLPD